jgi:hypothetical protein
MKIKKNKFFIFNKVFLLGMIAQIFFSTNVLAKEAYTMKDGELVRPTGYREWIYVGTPLTPNELNNGKASFPEFHNVYIDPKSWKSWKKTGQFPDGTILMKELLSVGTKAAVSGQGYFQGEFVGLEATIKSKSLFPNEPGNWAYFSFSSKDHKTLSETAKAFPTAACNSCHANAAKDDFVFTQYYPVLGLGKAKGKAATGGVDSDLHNHYIEPMGAQ